MRVRQGITLSQSSYRPVHENLAISSQNAYAVAQKISRSRAIVTRQEPCGVKEQAAITDDMDIISKGLSDMVPIAHAHAYIVEGGL